MNSADIVAIFCVAAFTGLGIVFGTVRTFGAFAGVILAFRIAENYLNRGQAIYCLIFLAVVAGCTIIGFLVYGATHFHPIDVAEGVFGAALGFVVGWGITRFIFHVAFMFHPDTNFANAIYTSTFGMDIYYVTPIRALLQKGEPLMNPKIFKKE